MLKAPLLLAAVLVICTASSADARRRHHGYYGERYSTPSDTDDSRRGREAQDVQGRDRGEHRSRGRDYRRGARSLDEWRRNREVQDLQGQENKQDPQGQESKPSQAQDSKQGQPQDRGQEAGQNPGQPPARATDDWRRGRDRDEWRRARYRDRDDWRRGRYRDEWTRRRAAERSDAALRPGRGGPFGAVVEKLVRGCAAQGAEFEHWPFDAIAKIAGTDEKQRIALEGLRGAAKEAAERLSADCPQDIPAAPSARLEAVEQGIDAALKAFDTVQPALATFYGALDDEQKARLYRDMAASAAANAPATSGRRERRDYRREEYRREAYSPRRDRARAYAAAREGAPRQAAAPGWGATCEPLAAVLRNWPVREIERDVRLDGPQRVAFYELVTASLKAADTLGSACPAETALTPVGRMETMRKRLAAVCAATAAIRPALVRFYEALDQGQKVRFAGMS
jgi:LTXXQ motif family protein